LDLYKGDDWLLLVAVLSFKLFEFGLLNGWFLLKVDSLSEAGNLSRAFGATGKVLGSWRAFSIQIKELVF